MVDKWAYRLSTDKVIYTPKDSSNLERCIREAVEISQYEQKPVELHLGNDIVVINAKESTDTLVKSYVNAINYQQSLSAYMKKMKEAQK